MNATSKLVRKMEERLDHDNGIKLHLNDDEMEELCLMIHRSICDYLYFKKGIVFRSELGPIFKTLKEMEVSEDENS